MKFPRLSQLLICTLLLLLCLTFFENANAQRRWKIRVKKPKITVGKPKIRVPRPDQIFKNINNTLTDATKDVTRAAEVAIHQTGEAVGKAGKDLVTETGRIPAKIVDVGDATYAYLNSIKNSAANEIEDAQERFEKGKFIDLLFHAAIAPLKAEEEAAFQATTKSGWLNTAGSVAASAYGGPQGAAAYAAWQTYKTTKNMDMAIRAGVIAGLTKAASGEVGKISAQTSPEILKKTILAAAIGGAAVYANGGSEEDVQKGLFMGGAMILIQEGYKSYIGHELDARGATKPPYCINPTDPDCQELAKAYKWNEETKRWDFDPSKLDPTRSHVGIQAEVVVDGNSTALETPKIAPSMGDHTAGMQMVAKIPGMNAMALFHDKWAVDWDMNKAFTMATIPPAIVITYIGTGAPLFSEIQKIHEKEPQNNQDKKSLTSKIDSLTSQTATLSANQSINNQDTITLSPEKIDLKVAIEKHQLNLQSKADSIVSKNPGTKQIIDGAIETSVNKVWKNPKNDSDFRTKAIEGIIELNDGTVAPDLGWEWSDALDPLSMSVQPIAGLVISKDKSLRPAKGWTWADPDDPENIKVVKLNTP